jgi:hypothetical protein
MRRAKGKAQGKITKPIMIAKDGVTRPITKDEMTDFIHEAEQNFRMTMAEIAAEQGTRDGVIYEMYQWSQFEDGSVFNALRTNINPIATFTAKQVVDGVFVIVSDNPLGEKLGRVIMSDMLRNAKAAIKNGSTANLAPRVK